MKNTNMIVGKPSSGKTVGFMFKEMESYIEKGKNLFIWDNKLDYYNHFYDILKEKGYDVKIVNINEEANSCGFNILMYPYTLYKRGKIDEAISLVQNISQTFIFNRNNAVDEFWYNSASDLLSTFILILFKEGKKEEINLYSVINLLKMIDKDGDEGISSLRHYLLNGDAFDPIYLLGASTIFAPIETRAGVISTLKQALSSYICRPILLDILANDEIALDEKKEKTALFFSQRKQESHLGLILLDQYLHSLQNNQDESVIILDNINKLPKIPYMEEFTLYSKTNHIISYFVVNNYEELEDKYGKYAFRDVEFQKEIKDLEVSYLDTVKPLPVLKVTPKEVCDFSFLKDA